MAEHGTRTMYVHYGCRCDACCRAEHEQYLKRPEAKKRARTCSKWGNVEKRRKLYDKHNANAKRYEILGHNHINWYDIADGYDMRCAICGREVDPTDMWINDTGRKCFGGK